MTTPSVLAFALLLFDYWALLTVQEAAIYVNEQEAAQ